MNRESFPPAIRLVDLVSVIGVDGVHDLALAAEAIEIAPKDNQAWRVTMLGQVVIGYANAAVVAGRDALAMAVVAARLRAMVWRDDDAYQSRYRVLDLALSWRDLVAKSARANLETFIPKYCQVLAYIVDMHETEQNAILRELYANAPDAYQALQLALAVYDMGVNDGFDFVATGQAMDEDEPVVIRERIPVGTIVKSA